MNDFYPNKGERQTFQSVLQERGSVVDYEVTLKNLDGSLIPCSISAKLQFDAQGNPEKIIGSIINITERKLYQSQLMQSQKVQSIGTLAGGIAHDFNNILGIILAFTSILERSKADEEKILKEYYRHYAGCKPRRGPCPSDSHLCTADECIDETSEDS